MLCFGRNSAIKVCKELKECKEFPNQVGTSTQQTCCNVSKLCEKWVLLVWLLGMFC